MLSVTDLTGYLFCARKLYFAKILGIKELPKEPAIKGKIKHAVVEDAGREDKTVIGSFSREDAQETLEMRYRKMYYQILMRHVQNARDALAAQGLHPLDVYKELWLFFLAEAKAKTERVFNAAQETGYYGEALWLALPKGIPELRIASETLNLVGVIDSVSSGFIPIEMKTGKAPAQGVWKEHMIQVGAYMLLLSDHFGTEVSEGYVDYRSVNEQRKVTMNPFLRDEIMELIQRVDVLLRSKELPPKTTEIKKCNTCGVRETCYGWKEKLSE